MRYLHYLLLLFLVGNANAQSDSTTTLKVGIKHAAPFVKNTSEEPTGESIDLWEIIAEQENLDFTYVTYDETKQLLTAVANGEVDLSINPTTVTTKRMKNLHFSQPYYISETVMVKKKQSVWLAMIDNLFSGEFFVALAVLLSIIMVFGLLTWVFEQGKNDEFRKGIKGLGDGFWWSAVTMTTVGYGDKSPVTLGGRFIAFIWMFSAIVLISSLTAGIASSLTVQSLESRIDDVRDLKRFKVGSLKETGPGDLLKNNGVSFNSFATIEEGLTAVQDEEIDFFIYDKPISAYHLKTGDFTDLVISDKILRTDYFSFIYPKNSLLRNKLDPVIVEVVKSEKWKFSIGM